MYESTPADSVPYDALAVEYYNEVKHPTCADFRAAAKLYLQELFSRDKPEGLVADVGCGRSQLVEFVDESLVLVDSSSTMLAQNHLELRKKLIDVEKQPFGRSEYDWVFAVLGDPFNSSSAWRHIHEALNASGNCIFVLPSYTWAVRFRQHDPYEVKNAAAFLLSTRERIYVPSIILPPPEQVSLIERAGLRFLRLEQITLGRLDFVRSRKISDYLSESDPLLDIYRSTKRVG